MSISWKSASGRSSLLTAGKEGYARLAVDDPRTEAMSERLGLDELRALWTALGAHLFDAERVDT